MNKKEKTIDNMDITIVIPIHKFDDSYAKMLNTSVKSACETSAFNKDIHTEILLVGPSDVIEKSLPICTEIIHSYKNKKDIQFRSVINQGETDFCSQINLAVDSVNTEFFSILEVDDEYAEKWFSMANDYYNGREDCSMFLPVNVCNQGKNGWRFNNEFVLAETFSNDIGYIDFNCLQSYYDFNITGGIINTKDFIKCGKYKPSIKISFNYELLLRMTNKQYKIYVVPKEGYTHNEEREDSLIKQYEKDIPIDDIKEWFKLAKKEYSHIEDRKKTISEKTKDNNIK